MIVILKFDEIQARDLITNIQRLGSCGFGKVSEWDPEPDMSMFIDLKNQLFDAIDRSKMVKRPQLSFPLAC